MMNERQIRLEDAHVIFVDFLMRKGLASSYDEAVSKGLDLLVEEFFPDFPSELGALLGIGPSSQR